MLVIDTADTRQPRDISTDEPSGIRVGVPSAIAPLGAEVLAARRAVILFKRRMRKLAKPAYVNTDAAWRDGIASLVYVSGAMGRRIELVQCEGIAAGEYMALLMAMGDAERCLTGPVCFRVDSPTVANLHGKTSELRELRERVNALLDHHTEWTVKQITRKRNKVADDLTRRPFGN